MNQVAPQSQGQQRRQQLTPLDQAKQQIMSDGFADQVRMALPEHISVDKFRRTVVTVLAKDPSLLQADRASLFTSCVEAAADGLLPNGKEAALVVYNTKNRSTNQWEKKVQYIPMIGGIYKKARNSGEIAYLAAHLVHENDDFDYALGFEPTLRHKPAMGDRGAVIGVYAAVTMKDGTKDMEFMTVAEVEEVRKASKASGNGPWVNWWGEMARKTAVRRLAKRVPMSADLEKVVQHMDAMYEFEDRKKLDGGPSINLSKGAYAQADNQLAAFAGDGHPAQIEHQPNPAGFSFTNDDGEVVDDLTAQEFLTLFSGAIGAATNRDALDILWENNSAQLGHVRAMGMEDEAQDIHDAYGLKYDSFVVTGSDEVPEPAEEAEPQDEPAPKQQAKKPAQGQGDMLGNDKKAAKAQKPKGHPLAIKGGVEHHERLADWTSAYEKHLKAAISNGEATAFIQANAETFDALYSGADGSDLPLLDVLKQSADEALDAER